MTLSTVPGGNNDFNLELFFELSPDLICIAGYDGYFRRVNRTVSKTLGYTNEELMAMPIHSLVHPEDKEVTAKTRKNLVENSVPLINFENRYIAKNGEIVCLSWTSMPIESEQLVFAIAKNVTHKRKVEDDRNTMLANLTKINSDLKQLTYTTSHDLRSPVSNLLAVFDVLDLSKIQDEETLEFIGVLKSAAENLRYTMNTYVEALGQKDVLHVAVEELNLQECLDVVVNSLRLLIQSAKAEIHIDFSAFDRVDFNRAYLESVFLNLMTNSIKYALPGQKPIISIRTVVKDDVKQLVFSDQGVGFDMAKVRDRIFGFNQKFHDHKDSQGIGLYLVHNHVASLGGRVSVDSKVNEGATFTISFMKRF
jgi:PAS domain S-box-containing protein